MSEPSAGGVPRSELEALVEEWRDSIELAAGDHQISGMNMALDRCAEDLEEVVENHAE